jgi:hypothetical protein
LNLKTANPKKFLVSPYSKTENSQIINKIDCVKKLFPNIQYLKYKRVVPNINYQDTIVMHTEVKEILSTVKLSKLLKFSNKELAKYLEETKENITNTNSSDIIVEEYSKGIKISKYCSINFFNR